MLQPGARVPNVAAKDDAGTSVHLRDLGKKALVVYFYPRDDTPGCTKEACQFNDLLAEFSKSNVDILGISADDAESHQAFREKYDLNVRLLSDSDRSVMENYGAWGERVGRDGLVSEGVIRSTILIDPDGLVERAWYDVKPDGHAAEVLDVLKSRAN